MAGTPHHDDEHLEREQEVHRLEHLHDARGRTTVEIVDVEHDAVDAEILRDLLLLGPVPLEVVVLLDALGELLEIAVDERHDAEVPLVVVAGGPLGDEPGDERAGVDGIELALRGGALGLGARDVGLRLLDEAAEARELLVERGDLGGLRALGGGHPRGDLALQDHGLVDDAPDRLGRRGDAVEQRRRGR
jgi:hypothetical protein